MKDDFHEEMRCIGMRIATFRKFRNMTQAELADKLYINKNYLSHIENATGNKSVSLPMLIRIARALDVELALLTDIDDLYKLDLKNFRYDVTQTIEEIKKLTEGLDKMLERVEKADKLLDND